MVTLLEKSFTEADIPNKFWCVIRFDSNNSQQMIEMSEMRLKGIRGISSSHEIIFMFLNKSFGKQAVLVMNGQEVVTNNKLSKILYGNLDYIASDNLRVYHRLSGAGPQNNMDDFMFNFRSILATIANKIPDEDMRFILKKNLPRVGSDTYSTIKERINARKINSISEYIKFIFWFLEVIGINVKDTGLTNETLLYIVKKYMSDLVDSCAEEKEWIIKNNELVIPQNSQLLIPIPDIPKEDYSIWKNKQMPTGWSEETSYVRDILLTIKYYDLNSKYKIHLVPNARYKQVLSQYNDRKHDGNKDK